MVISVRRLFQSLNKVLDSGASKAIFEHVRNYLYSSLLFAAGTYAIAEVDTAFFGLVQAEGLGWGVMLVALSLWLLNFYDGLRKLHRRNYTMVFSLFFGLIYVLLSVRIVEVIWQFRSGS